MPASIRRLQDGFWHHPEVNLWPQAALIAETNSTQAEKMFYAVAVAAERSRAVQLVHDLIKRPMRLPQFGS